MEGQTPEVANLTAQVDKVVASRERETAALMTPAGAPIYTDHQRRLAELEASHEDWLGSTLSEAEQQAAALVAEAETEARAAALPAVYRLKGDELARAVALAGLLRADLERSSLQEVVSLGRSLVATGDRAALAVWQREAAAILRTETDAAAAAGSVGDLMASDAYRALVDAIAASDELLTDPATRRAQAAAADKERRALALRAAVQEQRLRASPRHRSEVFARLGIRG